MPIQDSDPERRNLMVTSVVFIAYYYGGGRFIDNTVTLQVINANFSRTGVLAVMAWIAFIWFCYRYWVTHNRSFVPAFMAELQHWASKDYLQRYLNRYVCDFKDTGIDYGYRINNLYWNGPRIEANFKYDGNPLDATESSIDPYRKWNPLEFHSLRYSGREGRYVLARIVTACAFTRPSFSSYVVPYILAGLEILGAVVSFAWGTPC